MAFISLQQALARVGRVKQTAVDARLADHDGFVGASPSQVFERYQQRLAEFESGSDDFPDFE